MKFSVRRFGSHEQVGAEGRRDVGPPVTIARLRRRLSFTAQEIVERSEHVSGTQPALTEDQRSEELVNYYLTSDGRVYPLL